MRVRSGLQIAVVVFTIGLATACGSSSGSSSAGNAAGGSGTTSPSGGKSTSGDKYDPCRLISAEDVQKALGKALPLANHGQGLMPGGVPGSYNWTCDYQGGDVNTFVELHIWGPDYLKKFGGDGTASARLSGLQGEASLVAGMSAVKTNPAIPGSSGYEIRLDDTHILSVAVAPAKDALPIAVLAASRF